MTGGRVLWRLAWRGARAEPLRHLLIVGMIAVAVAASIATSVSVRTATLPPEGRAAELMGAADLSVTVSRDSIPYAALPATQQAEVDVTYGGPLPSVSAAELDAAIAELTPPGTRVAAIRRATPSLVDRAERSAFLEILAADPSDPTLAGFFVGDVGVRPGRGEALASRFWLDSNGVEVGDRLELPAIGETTIVGELTTTAAPLELRVIVGPDTDLPDVVSEERYLAGIAPDRADGVAAELSRGLDPDAFAGGMQPPAETLTSVEVRSWYLFEDRSNRAGVVGGLVALVLLVLVGFASSAAFATGTRRRVRDVGLLAAVAGATPQQLRALIRREALVLGVTGAALGAGLGLLVVTAGMPTIRFVAEQDLDGPVIAITDVLVPVVLGVLAALAAAWSPARTVARVPLVTALAGRVPLRRVVRWITPASIALTALGVAVLLGTLTPGGTTDRTYLGGGSIGYSIQPLRPFGYVLGVAAVLVGIAGLAAPLLQRLGPLAGRLPLRARLAVRDSARQRTRSAATVAATMVVLVVPVLVLTTAASEADPIDGPSNVRGDVAVVTGPVYGDRPLSPTPEMIDAARAALPTIVQEIAVERATSASQGWFSVIPDIEDPSGWESPVNSGAVAVATSELLELLGVPDAPSDAVVVSSAWQQLSDSPATGWLEGDGIDVSEVAVVVAPRAIDGEMIVAGTDLLERIGLQITSSMTLLRTEQPLTRAQANLVEAAGAGLGSARALLPEETGARRGPDATLLTGVFGGAVLLALVVAAMTATLAATESDRDLRTMASVGADPRNRPRFRAWQSGYHVLLGGVLAVPAGVLLAATIHLANGYPERTVVPWLLIAALVTLVPLVVAIPFRLFSHPSAVGPVGPRGS